MLTRNDPALILLAPCSLLLGALLQMVIARLCGARTKGIVAVVCSLPAVLAVASSIRAVQAGRAIEFNLLHWDRGFALTFHVDALSVLFALMGSALGAIVLLYSIGYMAQDRAASRFYATMLLFIGGFIALVMSANLLFFYLCWEVIGLCSFSLVGFWYENREAVRGARKVLLMTHIAGYGLLAAILVLYHRTGSVLWTDPHVAHSFTGGVFALTLIALIAKSVQVPLHTWIPEAMAAPTPVSSLLHAACYVTAGVYLAARLHSFGAWPAAWATVLIGVGTLTMALGVMYAMVQTDLKRMLAFSTVSQIGYMMLGLGIGTPLAITAGLLHCLNHGFFKGGLFLNAGAVQHAAGTRDMNELGGLAQRMPRTTVCWLIGVGNMAGIPLMSGFVSKWMLYAAALQAGWAIPAVVAWIVSLGTVFLCAKATSAVFLGSLTAKTEDAHEAPATMQWAMGLMAVGSIVLGVAPQLAVQYLLNPILNAFALGTGLQVTWFGLFSGAGSFSTMGGLVLALVSLVVGGAIYALAYESRTVVATAGGGAALAGGGIFTGGEPLSDHAQLTAKDFSGIFEQAWHPFFRWSDVDRIYLEVWRGLQLLSRELGIMVLWLEEHATALVVLIAVGFFLVVRWIAPAPGTVAATHAAGGPPMPPLLIAACILAAVALLLAALSNVEGRNQMPLMLLIAASTIAGLMTAAPLLRIGLLEVGAMLTVVLVWQVAQARAARLTYLTVVAVSAGTLIAGEFWSGPTSVPWTRALLLTSVCVKMAAVPMFFWLLSLADELPALVLGLIIAVVDVAAFGEFAQCSSHGTVLLTPQGLWLWSGAATSLLAALLMLTQRSLKRLLVLSTVEDTGFLLLGLASANVLGMHGALIAASTHALAKAVLFSSLIAPEAAGMLTEGRSGLAIRYPFCAFGFLFGMLAMLGVPPTLGYIGRWRLYESALQSSPLLLAVFLLSSAFALIAYVLALTRTWWGPAREINAELAKAVTLKHRVLHPPVVEPVVLRATIVALVLVLLTAGIWPDLTLRLLQGGRP